MSEDNATRRRGRPPIQDPSPTRVHVRMPSTAYDRAHAQAAAEGRTVPDLMRRAMAHYLAATDGEDEDR